MQLKKDLLKALQVIILKKSNQNPQNFDLVSITLLRLEGKDGGTNSMKGRQGQGWTNSMNVAT